VDNPFRWCDNLNNNDKNVLTFVSKAFAASTIQMAFNKSVMWAGENATQTNGARKQALRKTAKIRRGSIAPPGTSFR
jgi:uncharacterized pyridoxal phosphate-containing UPF0001 family protein